MNNNATIPCWVTHRTLLGAILLGIFNLSLLAGNETSTEQKAVELSWHTTEESAKQDALESGKPIFLYFTADWCHFCHEMEKLTLKTPRVSKHLADNYVLFKVDYDSHKDLVARYRIRGVPASILASPDLEIVEATSGFMPEDVFMAWVQDAATKISPEALAAAKAADQQYRIDTRKNFREGLTEDQYKSIRDFFEQCAKKEQRALEFAKNHLIEEVKHNPGRFSRFLTDDKLHIRILMTNAFANIYGNSFPYDPWDQTNENKNVLEAYLKEKNVSSLLEDLIDF